MALKLKSIIDFVVSALSPLPPLSFSFELRCRLLSGRALPVDLYNIQCMRQVRERIAELLGLDSGTAEVMVIYQGQLLGDNFDIRDLSHIAREDGEVTVTTKLRDLVWFPQGLFNYRNKAVKSIMRNECGGSDYMISFCDGSYVRHSSSPQLDSLWTSMESMRRLKKGGA